MKRVSLLLVVFFLLVGATLAFSYANADPGAFDPTYGEDGVTIVDFNGGGGQPTAMVLQADGKLTAASWVNGYPGDFGLARLLPNGNLDPSFGEGGIVTSRFTDDPDLPISPWTIVERSNGGYVVGGEICDADYITCEFATAAYLPDGSPDPSWGTDGVVFSNLDDVNSLFSWPPRGIEQPDGKVVIGGIVYQTDGDVDMLLRRHNMDGSLDTTFGNNGMAVYDFDGEGNYVENVLPLPGNKILTVGGFGEVIDPFNYTIDKGFLAVFNEDGSLDTSFGGDGLVTWTHGDEGAAPEDLAIGSDGTIYAAGIVTTPDGPWDCAVWAFDEDGVLDSGFGDLGVSIIDSGFDDWCTSIARLPDGGIALGGSAYPVDSRSRSDEHIASRLAALGETADSFAFRLNPDGSMDDTFGDNGIYLFDLDGEENQTFLLRAQKDGKLLLTGQIVDPDTGFMEMTTVRLQGDGNFLANPGMLDPTYGEDGVTLTDFGGADDLANANALMPDGKWVVGGWVNSYPGDFGLARYRTDGRLDPNFGDGGKVVTAFTSDPDAVDAAWQVVARPNGGVFAIGDVCDADYIVCDIAIAAYLEDGSLDNSFGNGGLVTTDPGTFTAYAWPTRAVLQQDGKLVVGGVVIQDDDAVDLLFIRYNADGSLDTTFGTDGITIEDLGGVDSFLQDVVAVPGGKIVGVGVFGGFVDPLTTEEDAGFLTRLNSDGTLDMSFGGGDGFVTWDNGGAPTSGRYVLVTPDNHLLALGYRNVGPDADCTLRRYDMDGNLDTTFGDNGQVIIDTGQDDGCLKMALTPDNKVAIIGPTSPVEEPEAAADDTIALGLRGRASGNLSLAGQSPVTRSTQEEALGNFLALYNLDGTPDTTFGENGLLRYDIYDGVGIGYNIAIQNDGKYLIAGDVPVGDFLDFGVLRLLGDGPAAQTYLPSVQR